MNSANGERDGPSSTRSSTGWVWLSAAWAVALVSTFAALFIGEVMGMTPCQLCWYQRILMFPLAVILGMAAFGNDRRGAIYALPLALGGVAVAGYHTALIAGWVPQWWIPCGAGPSCSDQKLVILGGIQIPWLSLLAFTAIAALLLVYLRRTRP
ncbi:disulfide bond formation protein B [Rivibacter subsaxonicus]|uniref:Disulfide bond formation protein DsbB n=1 Tax=Rivibacter subsaxonicus TaxID=457575 RepID=A0A4Q7VW71_9BURK|nr:disulfide bond formation protein B [Rivibacter subsaxonicus]RZU00900.1 disulfide bond formation protein DsbB [Rivibacter subsaxonicus]